MIQDVLNLYSDCSDEVKKMLNDALMYLDSVDRTECLKYCNSLCELKRFYPEFTIKIIPGAEFSFFKSSENVVIISNYNVTSYCTFFHELTHAFHYYSKHHAVPDEFEKIVYNLRVGKRENKAFLLFMKYYEELNAREKQKLKNEMAKENEHGINFADAASNVRYFRLINRLCDILDAIFEGKLHDDGLFLGNDNMNDYYEKIIEIGGHGKEYYSRKGSDYREIIANYGAIRNSEFRDQIFKIMIPLLGEDFMLLLEKEYLEIMNLNSYDKDMNNSNNIRR